ncbi:dTDP-glucose 4,6-dehydratase [Atopobium fossor]|uniref:dTDP-glucose 4,6-dehydratase n=1 Tax=Atopobium fossor TaxID=39487 RepID=UPI00042960FA|nr:GDP-mannose 4,6-dehydratase [Atopobium fossor]
MEQHTTPTYFVTGGAGFIGSHLVRTLLTQQPDASVVVLDVLTYAGNPENLLDIASDKNAGQHLYFAQVDICDTLALHKLFTRFTPQLVFHLAAESHVDRSLVDASRFMRTNIQGTQIIAECIYEQIQAGYPCRMLHVSTDEVYGSISSGQTPVLEEYPCTPTSPYSQSKLAAEKIVQDTLSCGLDAVIVRCCNAFGSHQFPEKLIPVVLSCALSHKSVPLYGSGLQTREWMCVKDHVAGIIAAAMHGKSGQTYNLSSGIELANLTLAEILIDALAMLTHDPAISRSLITHVTDRKNHDLRYASNSSRAMQELGWHARCDIYNELLATVNWYVQNASWLEHITKKSYHTQSVQQLKDVLDIRWID